MAPPAEKRGPEVGGVVRERVESRDVVDEPSPEEVDGERPAVHLREESHDERGEAAERAPVSPRARLREAEREENEDQRVHDDERPQAIGWRRGHGCTRPRLASESGGRVSEACPRESWSPPRRPS